MGNADTLTFFRGSNGFNAYYSPDNFSIQTRSVGTYDKETILILDTSYICFRNIWNDSLVSEADIIMNSYDHEKKFPRYKYQTNPHGQFSISFKDFYGETTVTLAPAGSRYSINGLRGTFAQNPFQYAYRGKFFLTESESSPQEKPYDYFEINLPNINTTPYAIINGEYVNQVEIGKISICSKTDLCFQPAIKTKYYMYSSRSMFTPRVIDWVSNRVRNNPLSSLEAYKIKHDDIKYSYLYFEHDRYSTMQYSERYTYDIRMVNESHIDFPAQYLKYYKLPLGTITTICTMSTNRSNFESDKRTIVFPKKKSVDILQNLEYSFGSEYICYIDSTIIHTDYMTRAKIHKRFTGHIDYNQYDITDIAKAPRLVNPIEVPNYVIQVFCRVERVPRELENKIDTLRNMGYKFGTGSWGREIYLTAKNWGNSSDRVIMFQGLTRMEKEFYSPDYSKTPLPTQGDYRRTLYWNPNVKTDSNGQASVEFYNNSSCTKYNIDAQTVTKNGEIGVLFK